MAEVTKKPKDISSLLKKVSDAATARLGKSPDKKPVTGKDADGERHRIAAQDAGKARARAKAAESDLKTANELIAEQKAKIEELSETVAVKDRAIEQLKVGADNWKKFENKERAALEAKLPPELKADAKGMKLEHLRLFVDRAGTGSGSGSEGGKGASGKDVDIDKELDAAAEKGDMDAINKFMDQKLGKGEKKA